MKIRNSENRHRIWLIRLMALLLAITATTFGSIWLSDQSGAPDQEPKMVYYTDFVDQEVYETDPAIINLKYPKTGNDDVNAYIQTYIERFTEQFKKRVNGSKSKFTLSYTAASCNDHIVSFTFKILTEYESSETDSIVSALTFDMNTGNILHLDDLFEDQASLGAIKETVKGLIGITPLIKTRNLQDQFQIKWNEISINQFSLDSNGITFSFNPGEIESSKQGIQGITVQKSDIQGMVDLDSKANGVTRGVSVVEARKKLEKEIYYDSIRDKKLVALTFDDGPHPVNTPFLLDLLKKESARATFFVLGSLAERYGDLVKRMSDEGHAVGSHSYSHQNLASLSDADFKYQVDHTQKIIESLTGKPMTMIRPPYGAYNERVKKESNAAIIMWNIDPVDWKHRNPDVVYRNVMRDVDDGDIILLHDIHKTTVDAVERIIKALKNDGFTLVTVEDMVNVRGQLSAGNLYFSAPKP